MNNDFATRWYTLATAGAILDRSPKTLQNLISVHGLPRRLVRKGGRKPTRRIVISQETLEELARITKTVPLSTTAPPPAAASR